MTNYYPYCVHGTYVGGCGADYMCGACEMGDEPLTLREVREAARSVYVREAERAAAYSPEYVAGTGVQAEMARWIVNGHYAREAARRIAGLLSEAREIARWADHEDDREWPYRRHEAKQADWATRSYEEQLAALPASVLDGP
jgi:hypothetical protein